MAKQAREERLGRAAGGPDGEWNSNDNSNGNGASSVTVTATDDCWRNVDENKSTRKKGSAEDETLSGGAADGSQVTDDGHVNDGVAAGLGEGLGGAVGANAVELALGGRAKAGDIPGVGRGGKGEEEGEEHNDFEEEDDDGAEEEWFLMPTSWLSRWHEYILAGVCELSVCLCLLVPFLCGKCMFEEYGFYFVHVLLVKNTAFERAAESTGN